MGFWNTQYASPLVPRCRTCGLEDTFNKQGFSGVPYNGYIGEGGKGILIITHPRRVEELSAGLPYEHSFQISSLLAAVAPYANLLEDCWVMPACKCPLGIVTKNGFEEPTEYEKAHHCTPHIEKTIQELKPRLIIPIGDMALRALYAHKFSEKISAYTFNGEAIPDYERNAWVTPIQSIWWNQIDDKTGAFFTRGMQDALGYVHMNLPPQEDFGKKVKILTEYNDVVRILEQVLHDVPEWFDFDYEANCIKAEYEQSRLFSASFAADDDFCYSFPMADGWNHWSHSQWETIRHLWASIMKCEQIKKSAHNLHMENSWTCLKIGTKVSGWGWDTMTAQHMINTVEGTKGLKHQTFVRFGYGPYEGNVQKWIVSADKNSKYNAIADSPMLDILHYGGIDSMVARRLRQQQFRTLNVNRNIHNPVREVFKEIYLPACEVMSEMSMNGFVIDEEYYANKESELKAQSSALLDKIENDAYAVEYANTYGKPFSVSSNDDMARLIYGIIGLVEEKKTKGGKGATDADTLSQIDLPIIDNILKWKKLDKLIGTYMGQYTREVANGKLNPSYCLHIARSGRSSAKSPNMQNTPKHDVFSKNIIRGGLFPKKGHHLAEIDYSSQEIRMFTCFSKDPVLIDYLTLGGDMHTDAAVAVYELPSADYVLKKVRNDMKMGWNFALLYGSYYKACAIKMWNDTVVSGKRLAVPGTKEEGITIQEHLQTKGVRTLDDFIQWCKQKEQQFWDKYSVSREFQEQAKQNYRETGYVESLFGFRRGGLLNDNMTINTPVQGSGSQALFWACVQLQKELDKRKMRTVLAGQVHDSIIPHIHPDELQEVYSMAEDIMDNKLRERFPQIIVPMEIEIEATEINGSWNTVQPLFKVDGCWQFNR